MLKQKGQSVDCPYRGRILLVEWHRTSLGFAPVALAALIERLVAALHLETLELCNAGPVVIEVRFHATDEMGLGARGFTCAAQPASDTKRSGSDQRKAD